MITGDGRRGWDLFMARGMGGRVGVLRRGKTISRAGEDFGGDCGYLWRRLKPTLVKSAPNHTITFPGFQ